MRKRFRECWYCKTCKCEVPRYTFVCSVCGGTSLRDIIDRNAVIEEQLVPADKIFWYKPSTWFNCAIWTKVSVRGSWGEIYEK